MTGWKKFGSPFDPSHQGNNKIPLDKRANAKREEERRAHKLRGCGDPNCAMCNPETAAMGLSGNSGLSGASGGPITREVIINLGDSMREAQRRMMDEIRGTYSFDVRSEPERAGPPKSYKDARKDVEKWLIAAPAQVFDDIVGNGDALDQLRDAIRAPVTQKDLYEAYGMKMPRGALLSGPPGCGKTMFARAAASEMKALYGDAVEFLSISGAELQSPYIGVTEGYIKAIFTFAREYRAFHGHPLLVFMDEAEVLLPDRTGRVRRVAPWEESQVATFLAEMDGIRESGAFVLLASNRPEVIDQAVLRDGRCDFKIVVKRPTQEAIEVILRKGFTGKLAEGGDIEPLVFAATECFFDPGKIILDMQAVKLALNMEAKDPQGAVVVADRQHRHFLLEHILSGAMAASIPLARHSPRLRARQGRRRRPRHHRRRRRRRGKRRLSGKPHPRPRLRARGIPPCIPRRPRARTKGGRMNVDRRFPLQWPDGWPRTPMHKRKDAPFKVSPAQARDEMLRELDLLGARDVNISSDQRLNRDGSLSAQRYQLLDPGVAVYFRRKGKDVVLACDQYDDLHDNIRAIGKTVEALRGIERWGASDMLDRAFTGFTAIAAPETWWQILRVSEHATIAEIDAAWREDIKAAHPDKHGGSNAAAARLNKARDDGRAARAGT